MNIRGAALAGLPEPRVYDTGKQVRMSPSQHGNAGLHIDAVGHNRPSQSGRMTSAVPLTQARAHRKNANLDMDLLAMIKRPQPLAAFPRSINGPQSV